jgi:hypothetical protein
MKRRCIYGFFLRRDSLLRHLICRGASSLDAGENLMPQHCNNADPEVAQLRDRLMRDLAPVPTFARAIGKSVRAVQRMAKAGQVDIVRYGSTPYVIIGSARKAA